MRLKSVKLLGHEHLNLLGLAMSKNLKALIILPVGWFVGVLLLLNAAKWMAPLILIYGVFWLWSCNHYVVKNNPIPFLDEKNGK